MSLLDRLDTYGEDTGLRIWVSMGVMRHGHWFFKATHEVNRDADVWWTEDKESGTD